jgi:hypothetical protein
MRRGSPAQQTTAKAAVPSAKELPRIRTAFHEKARTGRGSNLSRMSKKRNVWVLDTETKGTGAEMVPLERLEERKRLNGDREPIRVIAPSDPVAGDEPAAEPEARWMPRRFRVVSILSRQVLADDVGLGEALRALRGVGSIVDANVYVWEPNEEDWRPLTLPERRTLWGFRDA